MDIQTDWRYSDQKMKLRQECLSILMQKFGSQLNSDGTSKYSNQSIYECARDWVSQGNMISAGLVKFYEVYYAVQGHDSSNQGST